MRVANLFLFFFIFSFKAQAALVEPKLVDGKVQLGANIEKEIKAKHPDFKVLSHLSFTDQINKATRNSPSAIIGNFNGDNIDDAAFYGYSKAKGKFFTYAAISNKKNSTYKLHLIEWRDFEANQETTGFTTYLALGRSEKPKAGERDTIQIETWNLGTNQVISYFYSKKRKTFSIFKGKMD